MNNRYSTLVPLAQRDAPKFSATVDAIGEAFTGIQHRIAQLIPKFDIDLAEGKQLDVIGEWIGQSRSINASIDDYFFTFDRETVGFNLGYWKNRYDADFGYVSLDDENFRTLLRARIGANNWDGTMETLPHILQSIWPEKDVEIRVADNLDMSMTIYIVAKSIPNITREIIQREYLAIKPGGIKIIYEIDEGNYASQ